MKAIAVTRAGLVAAIVACLSVLFAPPTYAQQAVAVTLLHGIPGTPVDVVVDGSVVFSNFQFGQSQDLSELAGQTLKGLEVRQSGSTTPVIGPIDFAVPTTGNTTVLAHLDAAGAPKISAFTNDVSATDTGKGRLVVTHAAAAPAVDLVVGTERPIVGLANGSAQALQLPAGEISGAKLAPTGQAPIVDVPTVNLAADTDLIVYAVGSISANTFQFLTQEIDLSAGTGPTTSTSTTSTTAAPTSTSTSTTAAPTTSTTSSTAAPNTSTSLAPKGDAKVTLLHGIPEVPVDVAVNGSVVFSNYKFGETKDLSSFSGQTLKGLEVRQTGSTTPVIGPIDLAVPKTGNWTVIAHLDATGAPSISAFENDTAKTENGKGRLVVTHAAAAPAVDLVVGTARPIVNLANGSAQALQLPAGTISGAKLAPTGKDPIVDVPSVDLAAGTDLIVYAVGSISGNTFQFLTQKIDVGQDAGPSTSSSSSTSSSTSTSTTSSTAAPNTTYTSIVVTSTSKPTVLPAGKLPGTGSGSTVWMLALFVTAAGLVLIVLARRGAQHS